MPQYLLSVWHDEEYAVDFSTPDAQHRVAQVAAFNDELQRSGAWVFAAGLHPDLVVRLIRLGVLDDPAGSNGDVRVAGAAARLARVARLRRDLGVNVAGAVLACQLLARIDQLERRLERYETTPRGWR